MEVCVGRIEESKRAGGAGGQEGERVIGAKGFTGGIEGFAASHGKARERVNM